MIVTILEAAKWGTPGINGTNKFFAEKIEKKIGPHTNRNPPGLLLGPLVGDRGGGFIRGYVSPPLVLCACVKGGLLFGPMVKN